jgi:hypothetical protein
LQVAPDVGHSPDVFIDEARDRFVLVVTDLEYEMAALFKKAGRFRDEAANDGKAVAAGRQGETRFVIAHFALQVRDVAFGDVRRVRRDQAEV